MNPGLLSPDSDYTLVGSTRYVGFISLNTLDSNVKFIEIEYSIIFLFVDINVKSASVN